VTDEIALLKTWLDEAWNLRAKHEYDQVREVLDRALKQEDLIRTKIAVSKLRAQVQKREVALADVRAKIAHTRKALQETAAKKKALEGSAP
jgi:predicted  nucleic acid-binding Zn-ribbon protein